ncbi:TPA: DUF551 domain-containing protein [Escherichia coli]|nr:DUF551 domain-containing protein [Escherichia coli]
MTTFTDKELIKEIKERISSLDVRDNIERRAYEIALASLEAEPVAYIFKHPAGKLFWALTDESNKEQADVIPVYAAAPAPVLPHEWRLSNAQAFIERYSPPSVEEAALFAWNSCRAAMLHGAEPVSNRDELPLGYLQGHKDGLEWAAQLAEANHPQTGDWLYDDPLELAKAIRKGPDMPEFDGPTPVTPDGWISCSERMPNDKQYVLCWGKSYGWTECNTFEGYYDWSRNKWWAVTDIGEEPASKVTHWMPLPEPSQEDGE